jgi:hypothetical protein
MVAYLETKSGVDKLKDKDLYVINTGKSEEIKRNREELKADRFKMFNSTRSKNERDKIKELIRKPEAIEDKRHYLKSVKKQKVVFDIWSTPEEEMGMKKVSKNRASHRDNLKSRLDKIRRVVVPQSGQSYNPPASEHKKIIEQVIIEEIESIKRERMLEEELNPDLRPDMENLDEEIEKLIQFCREKVEWRMTKKGKKSVSLPPKKETKVGSGSESEPDNEDGPTKISDNPAVDRKNAKTPLKRKMKKLNMQIEKERLIEKKMRQKAHKAMPLGKKQLKAIQKVKNYNKEMEDIERKRWEAEGVVSKPRKLGLYNYSKPKVDFVPEEDLPDSFRAQRGTDHLVRDQFDSFYRRNLIPKEAPPKDRKVIKGKQLKAHKTTVAKLLMRENDKKGEKTLEAARERLRERKRQTALARGLKAPSAKNKKDEDEEIIMI